jgi:hypothetical protein
VKIEAIKSWPIPVTLNHNILLLALAANFESNVLFLRG